jgi:hypothetical protein
MRSEQKKRANADNLLNLSVKHIWLLLYLITFSANQQAYSQTIDSVSFRITPRFSFYSYEESGEILVHIPLSLAWSNMKIDITSAEDTLFSSSLVPGKKILRVPFNIARDQKNYNVSAKIQVPGNNVQYLARTSLTVLSYKPNEVKTDNLTGGLIVNRKQFFPFGFYCYSPVHPTLPEEEVVKGFNMISPYQKILPELLSEREAYMDRCARIGMKVHYNLLSVAGGGGVASVIEGITPAGKSERLVEEINRFKDHPALLAWYISDEPNGYKIPPSELEEIYRTVKKTDPWHPVSIVFMPPVLSATRYSGALDIVMADPYPIPDSPITLPGSAARQLRNEFNGKKPVWIVPQAFGGGELWSREPTIQEIRSMTYQAIINGARGIQYFVREGLNLFPKSVATWSECGRMALEIAAITPWLLSDEEAFGVQSYSRNIQTASALHNDQLVVMAVNITNEPQKTIIRIEGVREARARVLFENRSVSVSLGIINDHLPAYGSQVYLIDLRRSKEDVKPYPGNLIRDPGFEDISSPGTPAACYAWNMGDRGATYFVDPREYFEGGHSLRMQTPEDNKSVRLRFFPFNVKKGRTYVISVWAKSDPEQRPSPAGLPQGEKSNPTSLKGQYFELSLGNFGSKRFIPDSEWKQYVMSVKVPLSDEVPSRLNVLLSMPGAGVAWFDLLQVFEAVDLGRSVNPELMGQW